MTPAPLLEARDLNRTLEGKPTPVFSGVSFSVQPGDVLFLRGPSGAGKTLLLRTVALLDPTGSGVMHLRGQTPQEMGIPCWRSEVLYVHQQRVDFPGTPLEVRVFRSSAGCCGRRVPCGSSSAGVPSAATLPSLNQTMLCATRTTTSSSRPRAS